MNHMIATFFGIGHMRPAPGTWGSLAALPVAWAIIQLTGFWGLALATALVFWAGYRATEVETRGAANHDPSEIVIDEVAGQWIALMPVAYGAGMMGVDVLRLWPGWIAAFVLFRLFDIWKPGPIGWADRRNDAMGVMLDDVVAGVFAAVITIVLAAVAHGFLM